MDRGKRQYPTGQRCRSIAGDACGNLLDLQFFAMPWRAMVPQGPPAQAQAATEAAAAAECDVETVQARPHRISWARLLKRVFDIDMQHCPNCGGGELKIIAAILERPVIEKILSHLGLDPQPPPKGRAREAGQDFPA